MSCQRILFRSVPGLAITRTNVFVTAWQQVCRGLQRCVEDPRSRRPFAELCILEAARSRDTVQGTLSLSTDVNYDRRQDWVLLVSHALFRKGLARQLFIITGVVRPRVR